MTTFVRAALFFALLAFLKVSAQAQTPGEIAVPQVRGDAVENFPLLLKNHTKTFKIPPSRSATRTGGGAATAVLMAAPGIVDSITLAKYGGGLGFSTPLFMIGTLLNSAMTMKSFNDMEKYSDPSSLRGETPQDTAITITLWDGNLLDADTLYLACKDVATDASQVESFRESLLSKYPVEDEIIMEVKITNGSLSPLSFSPFSWHLYLLDSRGLRYKPIGYDSVLDQSIGPGETVVGKVYFPSADPVTHADLENGGVKGILEDMGGKTFHFAFY